MKKILPLITLFVCLNCFGQNIMISSSAENGPTERWGPNEPSIAMNPDKPEIMVAGAILDDYFYSTDGGYSWESGTLKSSYGVWGDPVIDVDSEGNFFYFHLSNTGGEGWIDRIVCQKSTDNGVTWSDGSFTGLNGGKDQDKQWSVVDRNNDNIYLTWTQFDDYANESPDCFSSILFSKSLDKGETWSDPIKINKINGNCLDGDDAVGGAVPAVGPNGEIYVTWASPIGVVFNKSLDQGETWLSEEIVIDTMPGGWDQKISGIYRANGLPIVKCDLSNGPNRGTIYVNWSDQRNGENDTDVWFSKSTDCGVSWTQAKRVNTDDSKKQQFFTWMDIDQVNGNLHFVFYDRRSYIDDQTDVFMAFSNDGGDSFRNWKISDEPFLPNDDIFFGDYNNIVVHDGIVRPIWTRLHLGEISVWTDVSPFDATLAIEDSDKQTIEDVSMYPNPVVDERSYISFKIRKESIIDLEIFDQQGRLIQTLIDQKEMDFGKYVIPVDVKKLGIVAGVYFCKLTINGKSKTLKTIVVH